jgi:catechol 2,3-dioxygenase-like lactoylglutathione lyase family enzyme
MPVGVSSQEKWCCMVNDVSSWSIRSIVINVLDLDRSSTFYQDVMSLGQVLRQDQVCVLGGYETGPFTLYLRGAPSNAIHHGSQSLGVRSLTCHVGLLTELDRVEERLRAFDSFRHRQVLHEAGIQVVYGHDPDRLPLTFTAYESAETVDHERAMAASYAALVPVYVVDL